MSLEFNKKTANKAGESKGKSGSLFFASHDKRFLIKTVNKSELIKLFAILDDYISHIKESEN